MQNEAVKVAYCPACALCDGSNAILLSVMCASEPDLTATTTSTTSPASCNIAVLVSVSVSAEQPQSSSVCNHVDNVHHHQQQQQLNAHVSPIMSSYTPYDPPVMRTYTTYGCTHAAQFAVTRICRT